MQNSSNVTYAHLINARTQMSNLGVCQVYHLRLTALPIYFRFFCFDAMSSYFVPYFTNLGLQFFIDERFYPKKNDFLNFVH